MLEIAGPVVARIPLVTRVPSDIDFRPTRNPRWRGTASALDAPLMITHRVGTARPAPRSRELALEGAGGSYYVDDAGELAFSGHIGGGTGQQAMRTVVPGFEYEVSYESAADLNRWEWVWRRSVFMFALATRRRGLAAHGCVFLLPDGRAVLCPGVSGTGKSTLAKTLSSEPGSGVRVLCDDRAAVTREKEGLWLWSTPWYSRAAAAEEGGGRLAALILPRRGDEPQLLPAPAKVVARELMRTLAYPFWSATLMPSALGMVDAIATVPAFQFSYSPSAEAARYLVDRLTDTLASTAPHSSDAIHSG